MTDYSLQRIDRLKQLELELERARQGGEELHQIHLLIERLEAELRSQEEQLEVERSQ